MAMTPAQAALDAARTFFRNNPDELSRAVRSALGLRLGVPLVALRWLGKQAERTGKVDGLQIDSVPPGLRVAANVDLMKTPVRAEAVVYIDRVVFNEQELTLSLRVEDIDLQLTSDAETPVSALIKSGALDLSNPGTLVGFLPGRSPILAEAKGNRIVLDLMRDPKIGNNELVRRAVAVLTSFVTLEGVETDAGHLDVAFRALPTGVRGAASSLRRSLSPRRISWRLPGR